MATPDDFKPYLPERYKQKVRVKQHRRQMRKIVSAAVIIVAIVAVIWFIAAFSGISQQMVPASPSALPVMPDQAAVTTLVTQQSPAATLAPAPDSVTIHPTPTVTVTSSTAYPIAPDVPVESINGSLSLLAAEAALRYYYPAETYTIISVNYSKGSSRSLFGFTIRSKGTSAGSEESIVFIDAATGTPWAAGRETAAFPEEKVKGIVASTFSDTSTGTVRIWYHDSPDEGGVWRFILASGNMTLATGRVDAETGELLAFTRNIPSSGRAADPAILQERAQSIASKYVSDKNGGTPPLNLTTTRYEAWGTPSVPAAGQYVFSWERLYLDYPVDTDRITVAVDAVTGDVIGYDKRWTTPDYAFSQTVEQAIAQRDAIFTIMEAAKTVYPDTVESIRILSSELRWNNRHAPGTTQRPGSVPLEWRVVFDDDVIRASSSLPKGIGWVNIQTGNVTELEYRH